MDRRLGRPLPHQLPNPTRANPLAINLSSLDHIRYYSQFPEAIPYQRACSHALLTRPPLTPKGASDLHVLGLPPAFILSQDQTLKLKCAKPNPLAGARPERMSLTSNLRTSASANPPSHPTPPKGRPDTRKTAKDFPCHVLKSPKQQKPQDSEAVTPIIGPRTSPPKRTEQKPKRPICKRPSPKRPNRPHIPSSHNSFKEHSQNHRNRARQQQSHGSRAKTPTNAKPLKASPPVNG